MNVWWVCAAPREAAAFPGAQGRLLEVGVGKTSASLALTRALGHGERPDLIVNFGVAGAYAASGLEVGDGCIVHCETWPDEGVETATGFLSLEMLGLAREGLLLADPSLSGRIAGALGLTAVVGATVSCCSGTEALAEAYARRSRAAVETMEGAAVATVAQAFGVPWLGVRTISNRCGDRERGGWDLTRALDRLQGVLSELSGLLARDFG